MPADIANSDQHQYINADPRQLEAGLNGGGDPPDQQFHGNDAGVHRMTAVADRDGEDFTDSKKPPDGHISNEAGERQNQLRHEPNWWKAFNWVMKKQQDQSIGMSNLRPPASLDTKFTKEHTQVKSSVIYNAREYLQEGSEDGEAHPQIYTKAAAETVHTFLHQSCPSKYSARAKYVKPQSFLNVI